mgnify:CR=1 FL=1
MRSTGFSAGRKMPANITPATASASARCVASRSATTGREALAQIEEHEFDIILTDLIMDGVGGLEILARPPGKKPQTMTLLSGGEQALTAMSLIFAVFLTNPSPICVLDEVDAPLDDSNVERFCDLLEEMRKQQEEWERRLAETKATV